jgi:hypothetical protein
VNPGIPGAPIQPNDPNQPVDPNQPQPFQPNDPNQPQQPGQPVPGQPVAYPPQPGAPGQPFIPGQPYNPNQPYTPGQPYNPNQPYNPGQPYNPNQPYPNQPYNPNQPGGGSLRGGGGFGGRGGQAVGQFGGDPNSGQFNPNAPNPAANLIQTILTTPRQPPSNLNAGNGAAPGTIGAGIAGVASKYEGEGIKVINDKKKYKEWEFVYDFKNDRSRAGVLPGQTNVGTGIGSPNGPAPPSPLTPTNPGLNPNPATSNPTSPNPSSPNQ